MKSNRLAVGLLSLSASGLIAIAQFEGFRSEAYIPVKGDVPTIGFGSTWDVRLGDVITVEEGLERLEVDTKTAQDAIKRCVRVPLTQSEFDAYTSFALNVGGGAFCSSTLVRKLNAEDYNGACSELKRWVFVGKRKVQGLVNRREQEYRKCMKK